MSIARHLFGLRVLLPRGSSIAGADATNDFFEACPSLSYPSHLVLLPCQLVWQEAKGRKLETTRSFRKPPILPCARRLRRRAQGKIGRLGEGVV